MMTAELKKKKKKKASSLFIVQYTIQYTKVLGMMTAEVKKKKKEEEAFTLMTGPWKKKAVAAALIQATVQPFLQCAACPASNVRCLCPALGPYLDNVMHLELRQ